MKFWTFNCCNVPYACLSQVAASVADHHDGSEPTGEHEARTYLGFNPYNYLGRESEGNRFITNDAL